jgi:hypothetical protein
LFLAARDKIAPEFTTANMNGPFLLYEEFGFMALLSEDSVFRWLHAVSTMKPAGAFPALTSKASSKIKHLVYCKWVFGLTGSAFTSRGRKCVTWGHEGRA